MSTVSAQPAAGAQVPIDTNTTSGRPEHPAPAGETGPLAGDAASVRSAAGANGAAAAAPAPVDPAVLKAQEKEHKRLEKTLHKEEKADEKHLKTALKATQNQAKEEKKAGKAETKARKLVDKYTTKEAKYAKGLARAQEKHDKMVASLNKAKQDLDLKTQERARVVGLRSGKQHELEEQQHLKQAHDAQRKATLDAAPPHGTTA
ncbi:hypothetical protein JCM11641_000480 [Rhodosporidiobolus odoratus]